MNIGFNLAEFYDKMPEYIQVSIQLTIFVICVGICCKTISKGWHFICSRFMYFKHRKDKPISNDEDQW